MYERNSLTATIAKYPETRQDEEMREHQWHIGIDSYFTVTDEPTALDYADALREQVSLLLRRGQ